MKHKIHNEVIGTIFTSRIGMDRGGGVREHEHDPDSNHFTICLKGRLLFIEPDKRTVVNAGELYAPDDNVMHTIIALDDGTELLHINRRAFVGDWMKHGDGGVTEEYEGPHFDIPEGF